MVRPEQAAHVLQKFKNQVGVGIRWASAYPSCVKQTSSLQALAGCLELDALHLAEEHFAAEMMLICGQAGVKV